MQTVNDLSGRERPLTAWHSAAWKGIGISPDLSEHGAGGMKPHSRRRNPSPKTACKHPSFVPSCVTDCAVLPTCRLLEPCQEMNATCCFLSVLLRCIVLWLRPCALRRGTKPPRPCPKVRGVFDPPFASSCRGRNTSCPGQGTPTFSRDPFHTRCRHD